MKSHTTDAFRRRFLSLPETAQKDARQSFRHFQKDSNHPGLFFKPVIAKNGERYWSVRVGLHYRALGTMEHGELYWFWIGTHAEYDKLIS